MLPKAAGATSLEVRDYAVPSANGWKSSLTMLASSPVLSDGSFDLSPGADQGDHVLLLIDTAKAEKTEQVVGIIGISSDSSNLLAIPFGKASGTIDLGAVSSDASRKGELSSSSKLSSMSSNFAVGVADLSMVADVNNGAKRVINLYMNDPDNGYDLAYFWYDSVTSLATMTTAANDPNQLQTCSGYGIEINFPYDPAYFPRDGDGAAPAATTICYATPPSVVTTIGQSGSTANYDQSTPLKSQAGVWASILQPGCASNPDGPFAMKLCVGDMIPNWQHSLLLGNPPQGSWQIGIQDSPYAYTADFSLVNPNRADGKPNILVPEIKLLADAGGNYTGVMVRYWHWKGDGSSPTLTTVPAAIARKLTESDPQNLPYAHFGSTNGYYGSFLMGASISTYQGDWVVYSGMPPSTFAPNSASTSLFAWNYRLYGTRYYFGFIKP
jgi:hypothetical protein